MEENLGCIIKGHSPMYARWDSYRNKHIGVCLNCEQHLIQLPMTSVWLEDPEAPK